MAAKIDPENRAYEKALRLLTVRSRTRKELKQRLVAERFSDKVAEQVLDRLVAAGLIDDKKFAIDRARAMGKGKGWGPRKLRSDLLKKGIENEAIDEAISQAYGTQSCTQVMKRLIKKRFGTQVLTRKADRKAKGKAQRYLLGRGFEPDEVSAMFES
jgi:regulatory protein